jgi:hypothetical protein
MTNPEPRNIHDVLRGVAEHWSPTTIAVVNDYDVRVVKVQGEFTRHSPGGSSFFKAHWLILPNGVARAIDAPWKSAKSTKQNDVSLWVHGHPGTTRWGGLAPQDDLGYWATRSDVSCRSRRSRAHSTKPHPDSSSRPAHSSSTGVWCRRGRNRRQVSGWPGTSGAAIRLGRGLRIGRVRAVRLQRDLSRGRGTGSPPRGCSRSPRR